MGSMAAMTSLNMDTCNVFYLSCSSMTLPGSVAVVVVVLGEQYRHETTQNACVHIQRVLLHVCIVRVYFGIHAEDCAFKPQ